MTIVLRKSILHAPLAVLLFATAQADEPAKQFNPLTHHHQLTAAAKPALAFREETRFDAWQPKLRSELTRVLALPNSADCPLDAEVTAERSTDDSETFRVVFQAEPGVHVPCYLALPKKRSGPLPVMICLQGHKKKDGMLVSIGRVLDGGGRDIAAQEQAASPTKTVDGYRGIWFSLGQFYGKGNAGKAYSMASRKPVFPFLTDIIA